MNLKSACCIPKDQCISDYREHLKSPTGQEQSREQLNENHLAHISFIHDEEGGQ
jgi:hypothetical protein